MISHFRSMSLSPERCGFGLPVAPQALISPSFGDPTSREAESFYRRDSIFLKVSQDSARRNLPGLYAIFMCFRVQLRSRKWTTWFTNTGVCRRCSGREAAVEQMLRRHRLWNSLVEVERDYRSQLSAVLRDETSETALASARDRLAALRCEIKARRQAERKRAVDVADLQAQIARVKIDLANCNRCGQERQGAHVSPRTNIVFSYWRRQRRVAVRQAQADSDLYWCNYDDVIVGL